MYLLCSTAKSFSCAVLTAARTSSTSVRPSSRRQRAVHRAPSGGTLVWRRDLPTIPYTPCTVRYWSSVEVR